MYMEWDLKTRFDRLQKREEEEKLKDDYGLDIILFGVFLVFILSGIAYIFWEHYQLYLLTH